MDFSNFLGRLRSLETSPQKLLGTLGVEPEDSPRKSAEANGLRACRGLNTLQYLQYLQYTEYRIQKYSTVSLPLTPSDPPTSGCIWKIRP